MYLSVSNRLRLAVLAVVLVVSAALSSACAPTGLLHQEERASSPASQLPLPPGEIFPTPEPTPAPTATPISLNGPVTVAIAPEVPEEYSASLLTQLTRIDSVTAANGEYPVRVLDEAQNADTRIRFAPLGISEYPLAERTYAVVAPFESTVDTIALEDLQSRWQGLEGEFGGGEVLAAGFNPGVLTSVLGPSRAA